MHKEEVAYFIEAVLKIPLINLDSVNWDKELLSVLSQDFCSENIVIPFSASNKRVSVAAFNVLDIDLENEIERLFGKQVKIYFSDHDKIVSKINDQFSSFEGKEDETGDSNTSNKIRFKGDDSVDSQSTVVKLVNKIIGDSIDLSVSDIHIEPKEKNLIVRYRVDGILKQVMELDRNIQSTLISRIKIVSNLNIAETRKPQDGKAKVYIEDIDIDLRVSILPTNFGEKVVIRLLDKRNAQVSFKKIRPARGKSKTC